MTHNIIKVKVYVMCVFLTPSLLCFLSTSLTTEPISLKFGRAIDNAGFIQAFLNRENPW